MRTEARPAARLSGPITHAQEGAAMTVDPTIDAMSHDPEDREGGSGDPRFAEIEALEARMRAALATKDNPMRDDERTIDRLRRTRAAAEGPDAADSAGPDRS